MTKVSEAIGFDERADSYETGWRARWHATVVRRAADVAMAAAPVPVNLLDVGCGTGALLRELEARLPSALGLVGVDPAPRMLAVARAADHGGCRFVEGSAEKLPFPDGAFDLVISTMSFDHWVDQAAGLVEVHRVLAPHGTFVLVDLCAGWLRFGRRARTPARVKRLAAAAGLRVVRHEGVYRLVGLPLVRASILDR